MSRTGGHTGWDGGTFSAVAVGLSATLAAAMTESLARAAQRHQQPERILSAEEIREDERALARANDALMMLLLAHSRGQTAEAEERAAKSDAALILERMTNWR